MQSPTQRGRVVREVPSDARSTTAMGRLYDTAQRRSGRTLSRPTLDDAGLRRLGVSRGSTVAAYLPNIAQTAVAFLTAASLGAIRSSLLDPTALDVLSGLGKESLFT